MATLYLDSFVGVKDATKIPPDKQDGRKVGAKHSAIIGNKVTGTAWNIGDIIFAGTLRAGESLRDVKLNVDASLGTSTLSLGPIGNATKYVNAKTLTVTDTPTSMGPKATAAVAAPLAADEDLYWTVGVAAIVAGTNLSSELIIASVK